MSLMRVDLNCAIRGGSWGSRVQDVCVAKHVAYNPSHCFRSLCLRLLRRAP